MSTVDFEPLADQASGNNVVTQAAYVALLAGSMLDGYASGIVPSNVFNKTLRQATKMASAVAQAMATLTGNSVLDTDGNTSALATQFISALQSASKSVIITGATFDGAVVSGNAVRWNSAGPNWHQAIADGTSNDLAIGFADVTNGLVYLFGLFPALLSGLSAGSRYYLSGSSAGAITTTAPADAVYVGVAKNTTDMFVDFEVAPSKPPIQRSYMAGLIMSTAGGSGTIAVAAGEAADSTNAVMMSLAASINKTTAAWAAGTNQGGLDTGSIANNTWYTFYEIERADLSAVDVTFSLNTSTPALNASYSYYRRIGAALTDGSGHWVKFLQFGNEFWWDVAVLEYSGASSATRVNLSLAGVPPGLPVKAFLRVLQASGAGGGDLAVISNPSQTDPGSPNTTSLPLFDAGVYGYAHAFGGGDLQSWTDSNQHVAYRSNGTDAIYIATLGYMDPRGKDL
jgi:hypothetical protein